MACDEWTALRLLGAVYEASLGWEATEAGLGRATKRVKALGAVYTPSPVVGLITERTLRPLLTGLSSPAALEALSVCDPACGAGAFLLAAMRALEDEALRRGWAGPTRRERLPWRRRLVAHGLFGVDIDPAAVHLTRLGLWLAAGGGEEVAEALRRRVRRGDALLGAWRSDLGPAHRAGQDSTALRRALDAWCASYFPAGSKPPAFHWELEFPERFATDGHRGRGWAAVVGNPPYVGARALRRLGPYLKARFPETYTGYNDLSAFFVHRGLELLQPAGRLGFIAPAYWFQNTYGEKLRRYVLAATRLEEVFDFGPAQVFPGRGVHTAAVILAKNREGEGADGHLVRYRRPRVEELCGAGNGPSGPEVLLPQASLQPARWVFASAEVDAILRKALRVGRPLGALFHIGKGSTSGCNGVFTLDEKNVKKYKIEEEWLRPCLKNGEIRRYGPLRPRRWLLYLDDAVAIERYPRAAAYLEAHRATLVRRNEVRRGRHPWWRLERPRSRALFEAPAKLVVPYRAPANRFTLDERGCFNDGGDIRVLVPRAGLSRPALLAALAIANSAVGNLVYRYLGKPKGEVLEFFVTPL
ncbi:MAG: Eco57I restriction-modification methylase domain-containing protein, partial [Nitrospinota bacterium]